MGKGRGLAFAFGGRRHAFARFQARRDGFLPCDRSRRGSSSLSFFAFLHCLLPALSRYRIRRSLEDLMEASTFSPTQRSLSMNCYLARAAKFDTELFLRETFNCNKQICERV